MQKEDVAVGDKDGLAAVGGANPGSTSALRMPQVQLEGPGRPGLAGEEEDRLGDVVGRAKKLSGAFGTMAREAGMSTMASMIT